jgi:hypothetical protein
MPSSRRSWNTSPHGPARFVFENGGDRVDFLVSLWQEDRAGLRKALSQRHAAADAIRQHGAMARGAVVQQHGAMTYGAVLCHNGATSLNVVLPLRGGPRETAARESWRAAGCPIGHAAACGFEKTGSERG